MMAQTPTPARRPRRDFARIALFVYMALFVIFMLAPILSVVVISFSADTFITFPIRTLSLRWYYRIVEYRPFVDSLLTSLELAFASACLGALLAIPAGIGIARSRSGWAFAANGFLLSPISTPGLVLGLALFYYATALGLGIGFLPLLIAHTVVAIAYVSRNVVAVYRSVPPEYEEAATILGAYGLARFRLIILPLIRSAIFVGMIFAILVSMDNLQLSLFFGTTSTNTLPVVMLSYMQSSFDPSIAAVSTVQMLIAIVGLLIVSRTGGIGFSSAA